ncbi:uncharacterized protein LOC143020993 isoform X2 [Oratosquilla oratoria]|uniref:uncharacterized protein LOC143020993 isoform X2 n=1 Tax=Oratosquilla oratoria TaxID=337810 RepID=UPI003F769E66
MSDIFIPNYSMGTCIYCTSKNSKSPDELLRCGKCQRLAHSTCLRSGIPPGQLEGDNFFEFTCQPCAKVDTDIVFRANLSITQLLLLTLYNLHVKNPARHKKGFFHWELDIYKYIVQHWNDLFRDNGLGRKEHIRGIILTYLSQYPHLFTGGHDLVNDGGWYKLCQVLPPAVLLHQEAQKKKDRNTNQGGPTNKKARFEEIKVKEEIKVEEDHLEDFTEDIDVGQTDTIVGDLLPPPLEESLFIQKKTPVSNPQEDQKEEDSIRKNFTAVNINMDRFVKRDGGDSKSKSVLGESSTSIASASIRSSTPESSGTPSLVRQMSDISDISYFLDDMDDSGTEEVETEERREGTRLLKAGLENLGMFFSFSSYVKTEKDKDGRKIHMGRAKCEEKTCIKKGVKATTYSYTTKTKANLRKHYESMHKGTFNTFRAALDGASKRGRSKGREDDFSAKRTGRQMSMEESFSRKDRVTPEVLRKTCTRWFIDTMMPLSIVDHPTTRHFFSLIAPDFSLPSRRTLRRDIDQMLATAKSDLCNLLYNTSYVATTADSWAAHNRAFIGMTGHWIGKDLRRQHCTLACREIKEKQTSNHLAQVITDIHQEFGLANKVVATTTDNGANYMATFRHFGAAEVAVEGQEEEDPEVVVDQPGNLHVQLHQVAPEMAVQLPVHYRCGAHTINLMATVDVQSVPGWNHGPSAPFTKAASKAQATWNLQNRSYIVANSIKEKTGRKLKTFCVTRWNSYYDAVSSLMDILSNQDKMRALNDIISKEGVPTVDEMDKQVLSEYIKVMKPVAECLDNVQSETNAYMGAFMPTLYMMRLHLENLKTDRSLQYAQPLVAALLGTEGSGKGFYGRFAARLKEKDVLMATALHPHYTMSLVRHFSPDKAVDIKQHIVEEVMKMVDTEERQPEERQEEVDQFHLLLSSAAVPEVRRREEVEETVTKTLDQWKRAMVSVPLSHDLFPTHYRDAWLDLFKKYNTPLPSSAAVERLFSSAAVGKLFSSAGDILRAKRSSLSNINFEQLVFVRGNMHLLGYKGVQQQEKEEEKEVE